MKLKFESGKFATPSLEDVKKALLTGLKENYEQVNIEVVDCPNLKDGVVHLKEFQEMKK